MVSHAAIIKQFVFFPRKALVGLQVSTEALPVQQIEGSLLRRASEILAYLNDWVNRKENEGSSLEV